MFDKLFKEIPRAILITILIFGIIILIRWMNGSEIIFNRNLAINFGYTVLYSLSIYLANALLFIKLDEIFEKERFTKKRVIAGFILSFTLSIFMIFLLRLIEDVGIEGKTFNQFFSEERASNYVVSSIITLIVTLGFHTFYFFKAIQDKKVTEHKIIANTASAQFESLKNQIDPHFLFNSLNVLSSLIEENPEKAQKFTTSLSKVYRYVLEQKDKELVSVEEELIFAKTYMNLLKMRFENSISFELPETSELFQGKVVPLSLQLLLENCIKHNIVSENKPLHIKISIENNELIIENNLQKKENLQTRKGVGIDNIVNRYAILTDRNVKISETDFSFKVYLPILTKQIQIMNTPVSNNQDLAYMNALNRVKKIKEFYGSLISYCVIIPILIIINTLTSDFQWFWFPLLGWGMGLIFHGFSVFGFAKNWEENKIREILNEENKMTNKFK